MVDYGLFADRLAGRTDRWSLLIEFQREWGFVGAGNKGLEFDADDEESAHVIPEAVLEWYALPQNSFIPACHLYWTNPEMPPGRWPHARNVDYAKELGADTGTLPEPRGVFMAEYEYCWTWSYLEREAAESSDPPVYAANSEMGGREFYKLLTGQKELREIKVARSVSEWALAMAVTSIPFNIRGVDRDAKADYDGVFDKAVISQHAMHEKWELSDEKRDAVRAAFPELGLLPWLNFGYFDLLGGPDVILMLKRPARDDDYWEGSECPSLSIAGRTQEALQAALDRIGLIKRDED